MDTIPVRMAGNPEYVAAQLYEGTIASDPATPPGIPIRLTFTGSGTFTTLSGLVNGVRAAILNASLTVVNGGGAVTGGLVEVKYSAEGASSFNIASSGSGAYVALMSTIAVPPAASGRVDVRNLLGGIPHVTIPYAGTALVQVISGLGSTDDAELVIVASPIVPGLSCQ